MLKSPLLSDFAVKYHEATATINTYYEAATRKTENQKNKNREPHIIYFCSSVHANVKYVPRTVPSTGTVTYF